MSNLSADFLNEFASSLFIPIKKGQCVTCMFAAGGGKRTIIKYILSHPTILKEIFSDKYEKTLFVYVDPDEILDMSNECYLQLIYSRLIQEVRKKGLNKINIENENNYLLLIKTILKELINQDLMVVFILNDFEFTLSLSPSIFLNLESILAIDKTKIEYLFLSSINLLNEDVLKKLHNFKYAIARNINYFPLFDKINSEDIINKTAEKLNIKLSDKIKDFLYCFCGGHPQLLKYTINNLSAKIDSDKKNPRDFQNLKQFFFTHRDLNIVCGDIWNHLSEKEKELLNNVIITSKILFPKSNEAEYLLNLGLVKKIDSNKYKVFGELFEYFIKNKLPVKKLTYNPETKKLFLGLDSCENKFTFQEFKLLVFFVTHENELISRDQVAEIIWGKLHCQEKYSDWSIDKIISIIRKKLDALGFPSDCLVTLKKRGFSFSNPSSN